MQLGAGEGAKLRLGEQTYAIRSLAAADGDAVRALFAQVFGHTPTQQWYAWKYGADGLQGKAVGLWDAAGRLIAHYAGFPRQLSWHGKTVAAIQIGDVMVAPHARGLLTRRGAFYQVCSTFFAHWVGPGRPYQLAFGFPNARAMRLGARLELYHEAGSISLLRWTALRGRPPLGERLKAVAPQTADLPRIVQQTSQRQMGQAPDLILGWRDADHVVRRFLRCPQLEYQFLILRRWLAGPQALAIVRREGEWLHWIDHIGPAQSLPAMLAALRAHAARVGLRGVACWASPAVQKYLETPSPSEVTTVASLAVAKASAPLTDDWAAEPWWWFAGDTDFL